MEDQVFFCIQALLQYFCVPKVTQLQYLQLRYKFSAATLCAKSFIFFQDDIHHNLRKYIIRYVNLSNILVFRMVSPRVEKRFPDYESMVEAKLLLPHEAKILKVNQF